jgi:hypothetical protein
VINTIQSDDQLIDFVEYLLREVGDAEIDKDSRLMSEGYQSPSDHREYRNTVADHIADNLQKVRDYFSRR